MAYLIYAYITYIQRKYDILGQKTSMIFHPSAGTFYTKVDDVINDDVINSCVKAPADFINISLQFH